MNLRKSPVRSRALLILAAAFLAAGIGAQAQTAPMTVEEVRPNLYLVKGGSGANTAFFVGHNHVVAVDAKMTVDAARQMIAEIGKVTDAPVKFLVITHSDGDHINGLPGFPAGLPIFASEGAAREMKQAFESEKFSEHRAYLPTRTFDSELELRGARTDGKPYLISLHHFGPAHTSGDAVVLFHGEKAAFIGDLAFVGRDPLIHAHKGGTALGYMETLKRIIEMPAETYLSGHADPLTKDDLSAVLRSLEEKMARVKALIGEGRTLDEIKAAFGIAPPAAGQPAGRPGLIDIMYADLTGKR